MKDLAKEIRKQKRLEILGTNHPVCMNCGMDDWECLEAHHVAGKAHSDATANVCRNCHRKLSDNQYDHPKCDGKPTQSQSIGYLLLGLADLLDALVPTLKKSGQHLIQIERAISDDHD